MATIGHEETKTVCDEPSLDLDLGDSSFKELGEITEVKPKDMERPSVKVLAEDGTQVVMHCLLDVVSNLFQTLKDDMMDDEEGAPVPLAVSKENLAKVDAYLRQLAIERKLTPHSFPLRPFDYMSDPRIVPHFSTSFIFPPEVLAKPFHMTKDPAFTLEAATRAFMKKAKYTPGEIDLVATSNLDVAQSFFLAASFLGISHLESLASIPLGVWAFYFPDRPDVLQAYFDIKPELSPEEQATQLATIREMLDKVYSPSKT